MSAADRRRAAGACAARERSRPDRRPDHLAREAVVHPVRPGERAVRRRLGRSTHERNRSAGTDNEPEVEDVYSFHFPFARGWYDPATKTAATYFTGGVNFRFPAHGIDLDMKEPEIEINGASSRAIFRFDGRADTNPGNKRAVLVDLRTVAALRPWRDRARSATSVSRPRFRSAARKRVFAGFYLPGDTFGCISVSFSYPAGP